MIIKQLEDNLRIAEAEGDIWSVVCIKRSIEFMLKRHVERAEKLFLREQPTNLEYNLIRHNDSTGGKDD